MYFTNKLETLNKMRLQNDLFVLFLWMVRRPDLLIDDGGCLILLVQVLVDVPEILEVLHGLDLEMKMGHENSL